MFFSCVNLDKESLDFFFDVVAFRRILKLVGNFSHRIECLVIPRASMHGRYSAYKPLVPQPKESPTGTEGQFQNMKYSRGDHRGWFRF